VPIAYTPDGHAEVAETIYNHRRLVVRRTRLADPAQQALFPNWRHHAFLTGPAVDVEVPSGPTPPSNSPSARSKTPVSPTAHPGHLEWHQFFGQVVVVIPVIDLHC
jgi:hypothetical protein